MDLTTGLTIGVGAYAAIATLLSVFFFLNLSTTRRLKKKYAGVEDVSKEQERIAKETELQTRELENLRGSYKEKRALFDKLEAQLGSLEEAADFADLGVFEPHFELDSHAEYVEAIKQNRAEQKEMVRDKDAVICRTNWTVDGKKGEGTKMANRGIRLSLRAFNNECDVIIRKVNWKNKQAARDKIIRAREAIDKLNESLSVAITDNYLSLKLDELDLVHQEALKKEEEREKLREQREREREEAKAQREFQAELRRQEKREKERAAALTEARKELAEANEEERASLEARIAELEGQLTEAQAAMTRVKSMAEQTRMGHVYVISNVGAFGDRVFKIGMTRRLEPMERVKELGDASVPFPFDVHAMIFSEDAPTLEKDLHESLNTDRVNKVNMRKEFFRVEMEKLRNLLDERFPGTLFEAEPDSREYLGSLEAQQLSEKAKVSHDHERQEFPAEI